MNISSRHFQRIVVTAMAVGLGLVVIAAIALVVAAGENQRRASWVVHTYEVSRALDRFTIFAERLETARRGYLLHRTLTSLATYRQTMHDIPLALGRIDALTRDNPAQQVRIRALRQESERHRTAARQTVDVLLGLPPGTRIDYALFERNFVSMAPLRAEVAAMDAEERRLLARRTAAQDRATILVDIVLAVVALLIVAVVGGAFWIVLRYTADLDRAQEALRELNVGLEDAVAARTAELSRANDEIQRFAYIVSHDLRSPLVNVMGFTAELEAAIEPLATLIDRVDAEAPALMTSAARDAKTDLPEAIGFIRTSTSKMDRLINSILRLSREGRRTLQPAAIDLAAMAAAIRDTFAHRLAESGTELDVAGPFPPLVSDRAALDQILSNLVENAVKYLQPGRPGRVAVTAKAIADRVVIDVADNGRGIAHGDHERIFELFRRSGVQDQPGEGLGLAHVRALAYRLGGVITCISSLGEGATFRLSLPAVLEAEAREGTVR